MADQRFESKATVLQKRARWFNGLERAILSLDQHPKRRPVAPESFDPDQVVREALQVLEARDEARQQLRATAIRQGQVPQGPTAEHPPLEQGPGSDAEARLAEGLPYQTLISSLLHKYASGRLKEI